MSVCKVGLSPFNLSNQVGQCVYKLLCVYARLGVMVEPQSNQVVQCVLCVYAKLGTIG